MSNGTKQVTALESLEESLAAWAANGHLTGAESSAIISALRDSARAVDRAREDVTGRPFAYSRICKIHAELIERASPPPVRRLPIDDLLDDLRA